MITEKLKKLLSRADTSRGSSEAEARTAMEMAQRLATEHGLDIANVLSDTGKAPGIETEKGTLVVNTKTERLYHFPIMGVLQSSFGVKIVINSYWTASAVRVINGCSIIGEKTDVALATYCWGVLLNLFPKAWNEYRKRTGAPAGWTPERSFYKGMAQGLIEANKRAANDVEANAPSTYAIVLANKADAVALRYKQEFPDSKVLKTHQGSHDSHAMAHGYSKGRSIKLGHGLL